MHFNFDVQLEAAILGFHQRARPATPQGQNTEARVVGLGLIGTQAPTLTSISVGCRGAAFYFK